MATVATAGREVASYVLGHLLGRIEATPAIHEPFTHIYLEEVFPRDVYEQVLASLPDARLYQGSAERHREKGEVGGYVRSMFPVAPTTLADLPASDRELWRGIGAVLTAPELKRAMFARLARDLAYRFGVPESEVPRLSAYARPTLYRETEGFEIPPHPDTRKKIVTMHLYFPADRSQLELGTALYRRRPLAMPFGDWRGRFEKVKQFPFEPNSGYAFVVNNTLSKKSWHGREQLLPGAGVRNTLLNTFYEIPRDGFGGYLA
jgi:hypothetical protein